MRIKVTFESNYKIKLPIHYNYIIQSFIYQNISRDLSNFLHDNGYFYGKRSFKLFTFSRLFGKFNLNKNFIEFSPPFYLYISSAINEFIDQLADSLMRNENIRLYKQNVTPYIVEVIPQPLFSSEILINTLSGITIYSTLNKKDGSKKTYYYSPYEKEFLELINKNLYKKFIIIHKKECKEEILIHPLKVNESIVKYKGLVIKCWNGRFKLTGSIELMNIAYDTGLGSKNSQGFGMFEIIKN